MASVESNLWQQTLAHVRAQQTSAGARPLALPPWLAQAHLAAIDTGRLELRLPRAARPDELSTATRAALARALERHDGPAHSPGLPPEPGRCGQDARRRRRACGRDAAPLADAPAGRQRPRLNPQYTFENFVTGPCNRMAHAAALAVSDLPGRAYNPLFIHASVGLGKSHLIQAICHKILGNRPDAALMYVSCEDFVNQFIAAIESGQTRGVPVPVPVPRRAGDRRHPLPGRQGPDAGGVLPHVQHAVPVAEAGDPVERFAAARDSAAGGAAGQPVQVGPGGPDRPAEFRDPRGHRPEEGPPARPGPAGGRHPVHRHGRRHQQPRTRRRRRPRPRLRVALQPARRHGPGQGGPPRPRGAAPAAPSPSRTSPTPSCSATTPGCRTSRANAGASPWPCRARSACTWRGG